MTEPIQSTETGNTIAPAQSGQKTNLSVWFQRIANSDKYMKQNFRPRYNLARKRLRSEYNTISASGGHPTHKQVNLVYSIGNSFVNSVAFKMPDVTCTARDEANAEHVENTELKINDIFKDKKVKRTLKRIIWDAYLGGFGVVYTDYEYADQETGEPMVDPMSGQPMLDEKQQPVMKRIITKNNIVINRLRPDLFRFPRGFSFDNYQDSPWLGFDIILPLDEVKADKNYDVNVTTELKGQKFDNLSDKENRSSNATEQDDTLYVLLHYVFEKPVEDNQPYVMRILTDENKEKALQEVEYDKGHVGYPCKPLYFNPVDDDASYPCGDPWIWESQLSAVDKFWSRLQNHTKRLNRKYVYSKRDVTPTEMQNIKSNEDMEFVGLENKQNTPTGNIFTPLADAPIVGDNYKFYDVARSLLSELSPKSALARGAQDNGADSATAANIINQGDMIDTDARVDDLREFIIDITLDIAGILEKSLVGTFPVQGKNQDGEQISRVAGRSEFTSKLNINVDVDSMQHQNKDVYRRQMLDLIGQMTVIEPYLNADEKGINFPLLAEKVTQNVGMNLGSNIIVPVNIRNPEKEHQDGAFNGIPMQVQPKENSEQHLQGHVALAQDPLAMATYEKFRPGFSQMLQQHIEQTQADLKQKQAKKQVKPSAPMGQRPPQATELQRGHKV